MSDNFLERKTEILHRQKNGGEGNYRKYLVNLYNYILNKSNESGLGYCVTDVQEMIDAVYEGNPDHMAYELVLNYKKDLKRLGYIKNVQVDGEWRTSIIKEMDF